MFGDCVGPTKEGSVAMNDLYLRSKYYYNVVKWYYLSPAWDSLLDWLFEFNLFSGNRPMYPTDDNGRPVSYKEYCKFVEAHRKHHEWLRNRFPFKGA